MLASEGLYDAASPLFRGAVRILKETLGKESLEHAKAECELAWFCNDEGNYSIADELGRHALKILKAHNGLAHADTLTAVARLIRANRLLRKWKEVRTVSPLYHHTLNRTSDTTFNLFR